MCPHLHFTFISNVQRVVNTNDGNQLVAFSMDVEVRCSDCGQPFRFCWSEPADPDLIPLGVEQMKTRPWVSFDNGILGICIEPIEDAEPVKRQNAPGSGMRQ